MPDAVAILYKLLLIQTLHMQLSVLCLLHNMDVGSEVMSVVGWVGISSRRLVLSSESHVSEEELEEEMSEEFSGKRLLSSGLVAEDDVESRFAW